MMKQPAPQLPILDAKAAPPPSTLRSIAVHAVRLSVIAMLVWTLRIAEQHRQRERALSTVEVTHLADKALKQWFGDQAADQVLDPVAAARVIHDQTGQTLGRVVQTDPQAMHVTGYRGSSNVAIGIDTNDRIVGALLLSSQDTIDHVRAIERSPEFFEQFVGRDAAELSTAVDAVSGATLTSLAIRDAMAVRLGGEVPTSTRFPDEVTVAEAARWFPDTLRLEPIAGSAAVQRVVAADGTTLGTIARTGLLEDHRNGYQGPTELLLGFDVDDRLQHVAVRSSFDNQPYVSYLDDEPWYWDPLIGKTWQELAASDLDELGVEGVSGATMTSVTAAETVVAAATERVREMERASRSATAVAAPSIRWAAKDSVTFAVLLGAVVLAWTRMRGNARVRAIWQWLLIGALGLFTGNLLSVALLMGWSVSGIAWRLAPGLAAVLVAAIAFSIFTKTPFYCAHVCPHGAIQQRIKNWLPARWRWQPAARTTSLLLQVPSVLLIAAYVLTLVGSTTNLAHWEPFDAYVWWLAASGSIAIAVLSIAISLFRPMAYCRFGCPTGQFLSLIRWHRRAGEWHRNDWAALALLAGSWLWLLRS